MPLHFQHNISEDTRMGIWKIEETEAFFLSRVPLLRNIMHPHKRLQHLAGRYLLQHLFPDFPYNLIEIADTKKPFLTNEAYHFSISHCGNFAAAIASRVSRVGVDIEQVKPVIEKIQYKFLSENEIGLLQSIKAVYQFAELLTICWSAKEAMFKWYGEGQVDFRQHMQIISLTIDPAPEMVHAQFTKGTATNLQVAFRVKEDFTIAWVITGL